MVVAFTLIDTIAGITRSTTEETSLSVSDFDELSVFVFVSDVLFIVALSDEPESVRDELLEALLLLGINLLPA